MFNVLVFDVYGEFGYFRVPYTTKSTLTYSFPPPPAIKGMLGAMLGLSRNEYLKVLSDAHIGIRIKSSVKTMKMGVNIINTKGANGKFDNTLIASRKSSPSARTQVFVEVLKRPAYRIYVKLQDALHAKLKRHLENHETYYSISLGVSEFLADFKYAGEFEAVELDASTVVHSVIPEDCILRLAIKDMDLKIWKEQVHVRMEQDRTVTLFQDVVFALEDSPLTGEFKSNDTGRLYRINDEVIYLWG